MDYFDLIDFQEEDVGPLSCYVCGTTVDVVKQDVITSVEPFEAVTLPVCVRCSSAVGTVLVLENDLEKIAEANGTLSMRAVVLASLLEEGRRIVEMLQNENFEKAKKIADLELQVSNLVEDVELVCEENITYFLEIEDLKKRIEAGAGLDDVELTIIPSADYEE